MYILYGCENIQNWKKKRVCLGFIYVHKPWKGHDRQIIGNKNAKWVFRVYFTQGHPQTFFIGGCRVKNCWQATYVLTIKWSKINKCKKGGGAGSAIFTDLKISSFSADFSFFVAQIYTLSLIFSPIWPILLWFQAVFHLFEHFQCFWQKVIFRFVFSSFACLSYLIIYLYICARYHTII